MSDTTDKWATFLTSQGAIVDDAGQLQQFANLAPAAEASAENWMTELALLSVVEAEGLEATDFLQAQFCNDVAAIALAPDSSETVAAQLNGYCNPKGRLHALFHLLATTGAAEEQAQRYLMILPSDTRDAFMRRLGMFVLRAQVKIAPSSVDYRIFGLGGTEVTQAVSSLFPTDHPAPDAPEYSVEWANGIGLIRLPQQRWLLLVPESDAQQCWTSLASHLQPVGVNRWQLASIDAGEPMVSAAIAETIIPQMINLQVIDGLSFKKGCYPGQEIVARMQYLGKLKRRMYRLSSNSNVSSVALPAIGSTFSCGEDADAGTVVSAAWSESGIRLLAVLKSSVSIDQLELSEWPDVLWQESDLPYTIESDKAG